MVEPWDGIPIFLPSPHPDPTNIPLNIIAVFFFLFFFVFSIVVTPKNLGYVMIQQKEKSQSLLFWCISSRAKIQDTGDTCLFVNETCQLKKSIMNNSTPESLNTNIILPLY